MSPGLPGLAIGYLFYAVLGLLKLVADGRPRAFVPRVYLSSTLALSGLVALAALAWCNRADGTLIIFTTQPLLLMAVLSVLAFVRQRRLPKTDVTMNSLLAKTPGNARVGSPQEEH